MASNLLFHQPSADRDLFYRLYITVLGEKFGFY